MPELELYTAALCPFAHRARLALAEKGLHAVEKEIDLRNKPAAFLELAPQGRVPLLVHAGRRVWESAIINEYLEETFPERPLLPRDPLQRATARIWVNFADTHLYATSATLLHSDDPVVHARAVAQLADDVRFLESEALGRRQDDGPYLLGRELSLADLALYPWFEQVAVLESFRQFRKPEVGSRLGTWWQTMAKRDAVRACAKPTEFYLKQFGCMAQS